MNPNKTVCEKCSKENIEWTNDHEKMLNRGIVYCHMGVYCFDSPVEKEYHKEMYDSFKKYGGLEVNEYSMMPPRCPYMLEHTVMNQDA